MCTNLEDSRAVLMCNAGCLVRWTTLIGPRLALWRRICLQAGVTLTWHADEEYDELPNQSRVFVRGLKSQDQTLRYSKFRGLTLSRASFPNNSNPHRRCIPLSVYDNAHNLSPEVIPALEYLYPPDHPQHRTLIRGEHGMNVIGEPAYKGAFVRQLHEGRTEQARVLTAFRNAERVPR